jgi:hypothetical protein
MVSPWALKMGVMDGFIIGPEKGRYKCLVGNGPTATFKFHSTKNGTRLVTKNMVDYQSIKTYFESKNLLTATVYSI